MLSVHIVYYQPQCNKCRLASQFAALTPGLPEPIGEFIWQQERVNDRERNAFWYSQPNHVDRETVFHSEHWNQQQSIDSSKSLNLASCAVYMKGNWVLTSETVLAVRREN